MTVKLPSSTTLCNRHDYSSARVPYVKLTARFPQGVVNFLQLETEGSPTPLTGTSFGCIERRGWIIQSAEVYFVVALSHGLRMPATLVPGGRLAAGTLECMSKPRRFWLRQF